MDIFINFLAHPTQTTLLFIFIIINLCNVLIIIRRVFFHPLSAFPGPRLAAATTFYKIYFEVIKGGELLGRIHQLHILYGPVIRIGPNELHFNDHRAYADIYSVGSHLTKEPNFYKCFAANGSAFGAIDPQVSKVRRANLSPFFSRRAILLLEDVIQKKANLLVTKLHRKNTAPINMFLAFRSATLDIITFYMFGHCLDSLNHPTFSDPLLMNIQVALPFLWVIKAFPWAPPVMSIMPRWLGKSLHRRLTAFLYIRDYVVAGLLRISKDFARHPTIHSEKPDFTIFPRLMESSRQDTSISQLLVDESLSLLQAGSDTVGNTCTVGTFFILNDEVIRSRLLEELRSVWPDRDSTVSLTILQNLPYLNAVIKESLRLSHGIVTPLPRIVGPAGTTIGGFYIPAKTIVGMSVTSVHLNSDLFPDPERFSPERWLQPSAQMLGHYLLPFSSGPRMCLGMNIAWAELYILFAHVFRKLRMEIVDTSVDDFRAFRDYFVPVHKGRPLHVRGIELS
ncbi:hypothetical protein M413DRAFT_300447 [Hebeloma cylindrosporum]|uniref:Cytochrome P450 n=1 Tax=Hebeloma cylindrosporum TaxID=76867 RepID=A0A0C3CB22_HEBCY|nr:hypothetical protein M413DRAFT_300447 [Hebeloma cylindrosporum h7]